MDGEISGALIRPDASAMFQGTWDRTFSDPTCSSLCIDSLLVRQLGPAPSHCHRGSPHSIQALYCPSSRISVVRRGDAVCVVVGPWTISNRPVKSPNTSHPLYSARPHWHPDALSLELYDPLKPNPHVYALLGSIVVARTRRRLRESN